MAKEPQKTPEEKAEDHLNMWEGWVNPLKYVYEEATYPKERKKKEPKDPE